MGAKLSDVQERILERMARPSEKVLEDSRQFWSKRYGRELTGGDAAEIHNNLAAYFKILAHWDAEDKANQLRKEPSASSTGAMGNK